MEVAVDATPSSFCSGLRDRESRVGIEEAMYLLPKQDIMPRMLLTLSSLNGVKLRGIKMSPQRIFHSLTPTSGIKRCKVSPNSTIKATQAARSSNVKSTRTTPLAFFP